MNFRTVSCHSKHKRMSHPRWYNIPLHRKSPLLTTSSLKVQPPLFSSFYPHGNVPSKVEYSPHISPISSLSKVIQWLLISTDASSPLSNSTPSSSSNMIDSRSLSNWMLRETAKCALLQVWALVRKILTKQNLYILSENTTTIETKFSSKYPSYLIPI